MTLVLMTLVHDSAPTAVPFLATRKGWLQEANAILGAWFYPPVSYANECALLPSRHDC